MMAEREIRLRLSEETAKLLADHIYLVGEHFAAGASIPELNSHQSTRLNTVMRSLYGQIGQNRSYGRPAPGPDELI